MTLGSPNQSCLGPEGQAVVDESRIDIQPVVHLLLVHLIKLSCCFALQVLQHTTANKLMQIGKVLPDANVRVQIPLSIVLDQVQQKKN
jgi:ribulose-5-phosphate 4-epimerase/fuculose-1-phosphate aldolase